MKIGLIKAIDNFDITQNVRFSTYAVPMILGEVRRYPRDNRVPAVCVDGLVEAYRALDGIQGIGDLLLADADLIVFRRKDPDRGGRGDPYLPGPGVPN